MKFSIVSLIFLNSCTTAQEWKPVAPTERLLYDIGFEKDSPGGQPSGVKIEGKGSITADEGSKVLQLGGPKAGISLPTAKLTPCQLGNQNPTLITFNLKLDASEELVIRTLGAEAPAIAPVPFANSVTSRMARLVNRPNVGPSFNLCHEFVTRNGDKIGETVKRIAPSALLVSINGMDVANKNYFGRLDQGDYDLAGFLKSLRAGGYKGPVGLQGLKVEGDPAENLKLSMEAWRKFGVDESATFIVVVSGTHSRTV